MFSVNWFFPKVQLSLDTHAMLKHDAKLGAANKIPCLCYACKVLKELPQARLGLYTAANKPIP